LEPRFTFCGADVVEVPENKLGPPGRHECLMASRELDLWAYQRGVTLEKSLGIFSKRRKAENAQLTLTRRQLLA
jgi:hypothetical protein